jgi:hypothetical protein
MNSYANPRKELRSTKGTQLDYNQLNRVHQYIHDDALPTPMYSKEHVVNPPTKQ